MEYMLGGRLSAAVIDRELAEQYRDRFHINHFLFNRVLSNSTTRFESHEGLDVLCIPYIDITNTSDKVSELYIFLQKDSLLVITNALQEVQGIFQKVVNGEEEDISFAKLLFYFFEELFDGDSAYLDDLEEKIMALEDAVIEEKKGRDYVSRIISFRRRLVDLKRYYGQLINVFNYVTLNENNLFDKHSIKLLQISARKVERLYQNVLALMEYVTQIREAYQAEVDINLNSIMKLFTVITTIFFPLTLIAGWYGMNFNMPEYHSAYGYPIVIIVSLLIVVVSISYFKKNKWF